MFHDKSGFVVHYEKGNHLQTKTFSVQTSRGTFNVRVATLFIPLQLHDSLHIPQKGLEEKYVLPFGGDLCSLFINGPALNFFVMDIMGHGFAVHKIAEHFARFAIDHRQSAHLVREIGKHWAALQPRMESEFDAVMQHAVAEAVKKGYPAEKVRNLVQEAALVYKMGFIAACQVLINLNQGTITFENYGEPAVYFILLDRDKKHVRLFQKFEKGSAPLGLAPEHVSFEERIPPDVERFKVVMFTDNIIEQPLEISEEYLRSIDDLLLAHIDVKDMREKIKASVMNYHGLAVEEREELIKSILAHMAHRDPEMIAKFFYRFFKRLNRHEQEDDLTLLIADFEKK